MAGLRGTGDVWYKLEYARIYMAQLKKRERCAMVQQGQDLNRIILRGCVAGKTQLSHRSHEEGFYRFPLAVERLSGNEDVLNILFSERLLPPKELVEGTRVEVRGSLRTFNNKSGVGAKLVITVLAQEIVPTTDDHINDLKLAGTICRLGGSRRTPLGREICDFTLAVNRRYGRSDYLPCIAWGSMAQRCAAMEVGQRLHLDGRLQSRVYTKQLGDHSEERVAFECSAMSLEAEADSRELCSAYQ